MKYVVIGLGNFGSALAIELSHYGHEIIGVDISENRVNAMNGNIASVFQFDATDRSLLRMLPLDDLDGVIVTIGQNFGASIQIIAQLRHLKVPQIFARAFSETHQMVLESLNVDHILYPETDAARLIAGTLYFKDVVSSLRLDDDFLIFRIKAPKKLVGYGVTEIDLPLNFNLTLISISTLSEEKNIFGIARTKYKTIADEEKKYKIQADDILTIYGEKDDFIKLGKALT
ncbi:MAG: potassium channel family protein [Bacteroidales bacterium]